MSLYIIVGAFLLLCSIVEFTNKKASNQLYYFAFFGLLLMLCLRYGQGTDYFAYQYIYEKMPLTLEFSVLKKMSTYHAEIGWKVLCLLFRYLGLNFYIFTAVVGTATMFFLNSFIQKYCPLKVTALFIAYPTLFLTYIYSGMRQGLAICAFLGLFLKWYFENKKVKFTIGVLICSSIHTSSLVLLLLLFKNLKNIFFKWKHLIVVAFWIVGLLFYMTGFNITLFGRTFTNEGTSLSFIAISERVLSYVILWVVYSKYKQKTKEDNDFMDDMMYMYSIGIIIYGLFLSMPTTSSRLCYFFKALELLIFTVMMKENKKDFPEASTLYFYISALSMVMLLKNIDSYISQGNYYSYITLWNYPYNNIFVKKDYLYSIHKELIG